MVRQGIQDGLHSGAQVYVSLAGRPVADFAIGEASPGVPMTPESISLWMSSCKPLGAAGLAKLWERGALDLDDPVARFIPEFGLGGKDAITLRHVLTHTGGFRMPGAVIPEESWAAAIAAIAEGNIEPGWTPGKKAGYHVSSGWFILAEVIRRIDGRAYDAFIRDEIFQPLGMKDSWMAMPVDVQLSYGDRLAVTYSILRLPASAASWETEHGRVICRPGASGRGPVHELGRFYEMLLGRGALDGDRLLSPQTVEALTCRHRTGMFDETFRHVMDWGLGFMVSSNLYGPGTVPYGFGPYASPRTFGHGGSRCSAALCDPEAGLVVAWAFNGMPGEPRHQKRARAMNAAIYEDLGLCEDAS